MPQGEGISILSPFFIIVANMNNIFSTFLFALLVSVILTACDKKEKKLNVLADKAQMIKTDQAFSNMSRQNGIKKAFLEFMDDDGILLRPYHMPVIGADAIDFLSQADDTSYALTWKPDAADIASSGNFGFTYGIYRLRVNDTLLSGTYVNIWKKQTDGKWKFVLNTGNSGITGDTSEQ